MPARSPIILLIGNDASLAYLIERYAERSGYEVQLHPIASVPPNGLEVKPAAVLFASIENFEAAQSQIGNWTSAEMPVLVCSSVNDQSRARELGADQCLVHPVTYEGFLAALAAAHVPVTNLLP